LYSLAPKLSPCEIVIEKLPFAKLQVLKRLHWKFTSLSIKILTYCCFQSYVASFRGEGACSIMVTATLIAFRSVAGSLVGMDEPTVTFLGWALEFLVIPCGQPSPTG